MYVFIRALQQLTKLSTPLLIVKLGVPFRGFIVTWVLALLGPMVLASGAVAYGLLSVVLVFF